MEITGWSINNRTILNCSHFLARRYFCNPFSPKRSVGEVGATPKLLSLDIKKMGKGTPGIISDGVF